MLQKNPKLPKVKNIKPKKCAVRSCRAVFTPPINRPLQKVCSPKCAGEWVRQQNASEALKLKRKERKDRRDAMEKVKRKGDLKKEAETACNAYIRFRDRKLPCISCNEYARSGYYDAGHFRAKSVEPALRFHEDNIHKQCVQCNQHEHANLTLYEMRLILKIGKAKVEWLKGPHPAAHFTHEELRQIRDGYRKALRELKKAAEYD